MLTRRLHDRPSLGNGGEGGGELGDGGKPILRSFRQRTLDNVGQPCRQPRLEHIEWRRWIETVLLDDINSGQPAEREVAAQHLVRHDAEGVLVGCTGDGFLPGALLGRDVVRGSDDRFRAGQRLQADRLGDSEVGDRDPAPAVHHHVGRLDVPMDDAVLVSELERLGDLGEDRSRAIGRDRLLALEQIRQRLACDVLHGEPEQLPALRDPVNGDDVGVIERGSGARLALEALDQPGPEGQFRWQHLDGNFAVELEIARQEDHRHAAASDEALDDEVALQLVGELRLELRITLDRLAALRGVS